MLTLCSLILSSSWLVDAGEEFDKMSHQPRTPPEDSKGYGWEEFERWADQQGISRNPCYWMQPWLAWREGYKTAGIHEGVESEGANE